MFVKSCAEVWAQPCGARGWEGVAEPEGKSFALLTAGPRFLCKSSKRCPGGSSPTPAFVTHSRGRRRGTAGDSASFSLCYNEQEINFAYITRCLFLPVPFGIKTTMEKKERKRKEKRNQKKPPKPSTLKTFPPLKSL